MRTQLLDRTYVNQDHREVDKVDKVLGVDQGVDRGGDRSRNAPDDSGCFGHETSLITRDITADT